MKYNFLWLFLIGTHLFGQELEPVNADRPDQSEGTYILPKKVFQVESGVIFSKGEITDDFMLRYGLFKGTELRIETDFGSNIWKKKFHDFTLSVKQNIFRKENLPAVVLIGFLTYDHHKAHKVNTDFIVASDYDVNRWAFTLNVGSSSGFENLTGGVQLGYSITDKWALFTEYYGTFGSNGRPEHSLGAGMNYRINNNFLIDMAAEQTIFNPNYEYYIALGFAYRFNTKKHYRNKI